MTLKTIVATIKSFFSTPKVEHAIASLKGSILALEAVAAHHAAGIEAKADTIAKATIASAEHEAEHLYAITIGNHLKALLDPAQVSVPASKIANTPAVVTAAIAAAPSPVEAPAVPVGTPPKA